MTRGYAAPECTLYSPAQWHSSWPQVWLLCAAALGVPLGARGVFISQLGINAFIATCNMYLNVLETLLFASGKGTSVFDESFGCVASNLSKE